MDRRYIQYIRILIGIIVITMELFGKFVWLKFATSPNKYVYNQTNYISAMSLGCANIFPMMIFIGSVLLIILTIWEVKFNFEISKKNIVIGWCTAICNVIPVFIGMQVMIDQWEMQYIMQDMTLKRLI